MGQFDGSLLKLWARPTPSLVRPTWVAHRGHRATQFIGSGKSYGCTIFWTIVAKGSDQKEKNHMHSLSSNFQYTFTGKRMRLVALFSLREQNLIQSVSVKCLLYKVRKYLFRPSWGGRNYMLKWVFFCSANFRRSIYSS